MDVAEQIAIALDKQFDTGVASALWHIRTTDTLHSHTLPELMVACALYNGSDDKDTPLTTIINHAESMLVESMELVDTLHQIANAFGWSR